MKHLYLIMDTFQYRYIAAIKNHRRISQARILILLDKERPITDIGLAVGFKHPAHFSRNFKHVLGMSPEQYRRRHGI